MKNNVENIVAGYLRKYPDESEKLIKLCSLIKNNNMYSNLFSRKNFEGHITSSAFIYCIDERKLLLLEHKTLKKFLQPGGHIETIDTRIIDAAKREVLEETGLNDFNINSIDDDTDIPFDIDTHFIPNNDKKNEKGHYHHDFRYLFTVFKTQDVKLDYNESTGYKWVSIDELKNQERFVAIIDKIENLTNSKIRKKYKLEL